MNRNDLLNRIFNTQLELEQTRRYEIVFRFGAGCHLIVVIYKRTAKRCCKKPIFSTVFQIHGNRLFRDNGPVDNEKLLQYIAQLQSSARPVLSFDTFNPATVKPQ